MEPELNCSSQCDSPRCSIRSGINRQDGLDILQRLCGLGTVAAEFPRRSVSPVLSAVMWTMLSCGILLAFCFLLFTLRFKNNRIVKMSSPNLNILTLFGSVLTYSSGFLFAIDERTAYQGGASTAVLHVRMWTLCMGTTLVFGPILGKTWRLYRVFTQRVPDKRVIIRDIQLMGLVALLILVDMLVLTVWNLSDPVRCSRSVGAVVKVVERDISYSLSQFDTCSSVYSDLWVIVIAVQKGSLLLYGTYLAGLTSTVSHPPVNQSPTIITAVTLVTLSSAVALPVSMFLQAWPNLVYSTVAGAIFICTLATNCMLFVPQLTQWRQFEEDQNNPSQMAKYFSSPSKSQPSVYSQDEIYYLLGENSSMKKLLNEKNAVIDGLQEQVNNAKDKLLRLMSASQPRDMDSSNTNLNSCSTQTTEVQSDGPSSSSSSSTSSSLPQRDAKAPLSPPHLSPHLSAASPALSSAVTFTSDPISPTKSSTPIAAPSPLPSQIPVPKVRGTTESRTGASLLSPGLLRTADDTVRFVNSLQLHRGLSCPAQVETLDDPKAKSEQPGPKTRPAGFVSSEQLQEILRELSVDAVLESALRSPSQLLPSSSSCALSPRTPRSATRPPPLFFRYPSISPYAMRKRRPPFHSPRSGLTSPCFSHGSGSEAAGVGRTATTTRDSYGEQRRNPGKHRESHVRNNDLELHEEDEMGEENGDAEGRGAMRKKGRRCASRSHRCPVSPRAELGNVASPDVEAGVDNHRCRRIRDSCGYYDSDSSSSSTDYCYYHRPYCDSCLQRGAILCSDSSSSDSSSEDGEYEGYTSLYRSAHPVVFKEDLQPTFV